MAVTELNALNKAQAYQLADITKTPAAIRRDYTALAYTFSGIQRAGCGNLPRKQSG